MKVSVMRQNKYLLDETMAAFFERLYTDDYWNDYKMPDGKEVQEEYKSWQASYNRDMKVTTLIGKQNLEFEMELNGEIRQQGLTREMLFTVDQIISHVSKYMTLKIGDLIYTGTPVGVGAVNRGDNIKARLGGRTLLDFDVR